MVKKNTHYQLGRSVSDVISQTQRNKIARQAVVDLSEYRSSFFQEPSSRVLVIDHSEISRGAVQRVLQSDGYEVYTASDAIEVAQVMELRRLDLLVIDVEIPWVNGFELCSLIKQHPKSAKLPIVLIGDSDSQEQVKAGTYTDCDGFLVKPFGADYLTDMINDLLSDNT